MKIKTIVRGDNHGFRLAKRFDGLRITQTGEIANDAGKAGTRGAPLTNGGSGGGGGGALVMPGAGLLMNNGLVLGGGGGIGGAGYSTTIQYHSGTDGGTGGAGGLGATISNYGSVQNLGSLSGGAGGAGGSGGAGGDGGAGGRGGSGGAGGDGLFDVSGASMDNGGQITGGAGGAAGAGYSQLSANAGGGGGAGVVLGVSHLLNNQGVIAGGDGGTGGSELGAYGGQGGYGGAGGVGLQLLLAGAVGNSGAIMGGAGGVGGAASQGVLNSFSGAGGTGASAIILSRGGALINSGTIEGGRGGDAGACTGFASGVGGAGGDAVDLGGYGTVTNLGLIAGGDGGKAYQVNGGVAGKGILLSAGGVVVNGSTSNTAAVISGYTAVALYGPGKIINFGTIESLGSAFFGSTTGVNLVDGGTVDNFGTIETSNVYDGQTLDSIGVNAFRGGTVVNGSTSDPVAVISGHTGVALYGPGILTNFGTILGSDQFSFLFSLPTGVYMKSGGVLINGSANDHAALISGFYGVVGSDTTTILNYGTISSMSTASVFAVGGRLIVEAGSSIVGYAIGPGTLELAAAVGTITGLGSTAAASGEISMSFLDFGSYVFDSGGQWTLTGANSLTKSQNLTLDAGATLTLGSGASLTLAGASALSGTVNGVGTISVADATVSDLTIGGLDRLLVVGSVAQNGTIMIGDASTDAATLAINKGGVWKLDAGNIARGAASGSRIVDSGLLIGSAGSGIDTISVVVADFGVVEASSGTLDLTQAVTGAGTLKIDAGATLQLDAGAGSGLSLSFNGSNATLAIGRPSAFSATISGLAISDTIDLLGAVATSASINASDQLIVLNGSRTVATLQLAGDYAGASFGVGSDGHGGADIALIATTAAPQAFVAAMAGFGASAPATTIDVPIDHLQTHQQLLLTSPGPA